MIRRQWFVAFSALLMGCGGGTAYHLARGGICLKEGNTERALSHYQQVVAHKPDFSLGYLTRGRAYLLQGRWSLAIADFAKAASFHDEVEPFALRHLYQTQFLAALTTQPSLHPVLAAELEAGFDRVVGLQPDEPGGYLWRGLFCLAVGRDEDARADIDAYGRMRPDRRDAVAGLFSSLQDSRDDNQTWNIPNTFWLD